MVITTGLIVAGCIWLLGFLIVMGNIFFFPSRYGKYKDQYDTGLRSFDVDEKRYKNVKRVGLAFLGIAVITSWLFGGL